MGSLDVLGYRRNFLLMRPPVGAMWTRRVKKGLEKVQRTEGIGTVIHTRKKGVLSGVGSGVCESRLYSA